MELLYSIVHADARVAHALVSASCGAASTHPLGPFLPRSRTWTAAPISSADPACSSLFVDLYGIRRDNAAYAHGNSIDATAKARRELGLDHVSQSGLVPTWRWTPSNQTGYKPEDRVGLPTDTHLCIITSFLFSPYIILLSG